MNASHTNRCLPGIGVFQAQYESDQLKQYTSSEIAFKGTDSGRTSLNSLMRDRET